MANDSALGKTVERVQADILAVNQDVQKYQALNARYKDHAATFSAFAANLMALQGKLNANVAVTAADATNLITTANMKIVPQISAMISTNTQVLGMGPLSTSKNIPDAIAKALSRKLSTLQGSVTALVIALQTITAAAGAGQDKPDQDHGGGGEIPLAPVTLSGTPAVIASPTLDDLAAGFADLVKSMKHVNAERGAVTPPTNA